MVQLNLVLFWRSILIFLVSLSTSSFWLFPHPFPCLPISVPCLPLSLYPFVCSVLSLCSCVSLSHQPTVPVCQPACLVFQFPFCLTWTENCDSEPLFLKNKTAPYSSSFGVNVSGSPEIPNWFKNNLLTPSTYSKYKPQDIYVQYLNSVYIHYLKWVRDIWVF